MTKDYSYSKPEHDRYDSGYCHGYLEFAITCLGNKITLIADLPIIKLNYL